MNLNLQLTIDEVNIILRSLSKHPFDEVVNLITKIRQQGESQIPKQEAAEAPAEAPAA